LNKGMAVGMTLVNVDRERLGSYLQEILETQYSLCKVSVEVKLVLLVDLTLGRYGC